MSRDYKGDWYFGPYRPGHKHYKQKHKTHVKIRAEQALKRLREVQSYFQICNPLREDGVITETRRLPSNYQQYAYDKLEYIVEDLQYMIDRLDK